MAHFQLPMQRRPFSTTIGGTRAYLSGSSGDEAIVIEMGKPVTIEVVGVTGAAPTITQLPLAGLVAQVRIFLGSGASTPSSWPDILSLSALSGKGAKRSLTITPIRPGAAVLQVDGTNPVGVFVGNFKNHPGMQHDLIANVFRASDPAKTHVLMRLLHNNADNLFNEQSDYNVGRWKPLACGTVSKVGGAAVFFEKLNYDYKEYYRKPIGGRTRDKIKIDNAKLDASLKAIQARLAKGIPSVVGLVYDPSSAIDRKGDINVTGTGGHSVPIVGCSADRKKFLYIDVYQEGSKLKYGGGHAGHHLFPHACDYLGLFEVKHDALRAIDILRSTTPGRDSVFHGSQFLEVVSGPLTP
jgi:hypothetical protein